jgi:eukaryotic translation initiation factor 2C
MKLIFLLFFNSFPIDDQMNMKSVVEYFKEMYGFTIQHRHLPCLQVGNQKKANYLPMEVSILINSQTYAYLVNYVYVSSKCLLVAL